MDLTPKSYRDPTQYFAAFCPHPSSNPLIYPTPPQSSELTDVVQARSPVISGQAGLGIINGGLPSPSVQTMPMGGNSPETLLPPTQCWAQGPTSSACFSDTSPNLSSYTGQNLYDNVYDFDFKARSTPVPVSRPGMASQVISSTANKWSFQGDNLSYEPPVTSVPSNYNYHSNDLPVMNRANLDDGGMSATQRASNTMPTYKGPPRKRQKRSNAATGKYQCDICGMNFTRNSNCRSHMKIHDPNRKYPHKCMYANCTKKFSRKTDLVRHIDSVRSLISCSSNSH